MIFQKAIYNWHSEIPYANQYAAYSDCFIFFIYTETSPRDMSRLTNRSAIEICTICNTANKAYVKVIETCHKIVFVLSQLT